MSILNDQHMYFSHDYDLTHSIQRVVKMNEDTAQRQVRSFVFCFVSFLLILRVSPFYCHCQS
jgi:hypothetical protein